MTKDNLAGMGSSLFISRLPATYAECQRAIELSVSTDQWIDLGKLAEIPTGSNRPCAAYKVFETNVTLYEKHYRAQVVHSSSHDKRQQKKIAKAIIKSEQSLKKQLASFTTTYYCEADAKKAACQVEELSKDLHFVKTTITMQEVRKPGRPAVGKATPTNSRYILSWELIQNGSAIEREKQMAGCFVLLTNVPSSNENAMDSKKLLMTYKGQYCIESDFAFLIDPLIVNDIFLKKPNRIDALAMILIIALMIWRLMERSMRIYLQNTKKLLIGWEKRQTDKPTSFMMTTVMIGIMIAVVNGTRVFLRHPGSRQTDFLNALGLTDEVFLDPKCKCQPIIDRKLTG